MEFAFVTTNLVDLWSEPRFNTERVSQALFGQPVQVTRKLRGYARVRLADGYAGWCDVRFLKPLSENEYGRGLESVNSVVTAREARLQGTLTGNETAPFYLYYGTKLTVRPSGLGYSEIVLPDRSQVYVKTGVLEPIPKGRPADGLAALVVREARRFLGVPYLWGGITPAGFDCSGFVQAVLGRFGVVIPRDTRDQIHAGEAVPEERTLTGDLLFFERHVGLAIGRTRVIHSSVAGGGVRINSLTPEGEDYREDLHRSYVQTRRVVS